MEFATNKPIYRQIIDYCYAQVLTGAWQPGSRVPSVRELAVQMAVNTHTILKAYETLQADAVIEPRRGMGFFLYGDAREKVNEARRREFFASTIPMLRQEMELLGITPGDLLNHLT